MSIQSNKLVNLADAQVLYNDLRDRDSSLKSAIAEEFSATKAYSTGEYVWHNGNLYRFTIPHAAGEWQDFTDAKQIELTDDVYKNLKMIASPYSTTSTYSVGDFCIYNSYIYKCKTAITTGESFNASKWVIVTFASEMKTANGLLACVSPTTDHELNGILKRLYIPSTVSIDLTAVNRVTIYNGAANLYGFRMFNSSNTKLLDFTRSSTFTGLWKIGNVIADIGSLSSISATSKNYYCTVNDSVLRTDYLLAEYNLLPIPNAVEKDHNVLAGIAVSSNAELNTILKRLYIPKSLNINLSSITRAVVFNGYSGFYGVRLYNGATLVVAVTPTSYFTGYECNSDGVYIEVGDLTSIGATSKEYTCTIYPSVNEENGIIDDYWEYRNAKNNSTSGSYTPSAQETQGNNVGTNVKVMSYNVAKYNNDVASEIIPAEKVKNFISEVSKINADILCIQEDTRYIDNDTVPDADKRTTNEYLYYPQYPYTTGLFQTTVRSKFAADSYGVVTYSNGRWLGYGVYTFGAKKLLAVSTHPIAGTDAENITARATQYAELFKWIKGDINLSEYDIPTQTTGDPVHVPTHTHVVIGMDANSLTATDLSNLSDLAAEYGFIMGNGGRMGWQKTARNRFNWFSIDNIIVSNNIIINSFESMSEKYSDLYSDHVPVVADVTLL